MRDHLMGIEHNEVEIEYTSIKDLRDIKEEVEKLRIRKKLLTQV
jgi:hypothetical protein